ncbi:hypothetical protein LTV02_22655 [Nocardia yamanashiensis]|uniref:hypothetical protein n=1 Tax=Nocardia yamanashiensis TaxID=209247 RepID=UPI001E4EC245|nr:hypothetical protein [Nocardia yamanashiensis]UGT46052.1 hypothetical protein LTV02_22655 [Nocardia yamanashiensis]
MTDTIDADRLLQIEPAHIPDRLARMTAAERKTMASALKQARSALPRRDWWEEPSKKHVAVQLWGLGCLSTPTSVARWLSVGVTRLPDTSPEVLLACLEAGDRDNAWRAELAAQLAAGRAERWQGLPYFPLIVHLIRTSGAPVPTTDEFVRAWMRSRFGQDGLPDPWRAHQLPSGPNLVARLRIDPFLPALARRVVEVTGLFLNDNPHLPDDSWPHTLDVLSREGVVDRDLLHTSTLNALLRNDGRPLDATNRLGVLTALHAEPSECAGRTDAYARLLAEGRSTVAGHAQEVLIGLHGAGLLSDDEALALSDEALARTEKKLVRAQLSWMERIVRAEPAHASAAIRSWSAALATLEDAALRARIEKLIARYLPKADDDTRMDLAVEAAPELEEEFPLPLPPAPAVLTGLPETPADTAELYRWLKAADDEEEFYGARFLDGLIRFAATDRPGLTAALRPLVEADLAVVNSAGTAWWQDKWWKNRGWEQLTVAAVATGLLQDRPQGSSHSDMVTLRMIEWGEYALTGAPLPPCALATPTFENGQIAAAELVDRLRRYREAGVRPGHLEFGQALARVAPEADAETAMAAAALGMPEGFRLAAVLNGEPPADLPAILDGVQRGPDHEWGWMPVEAVDFPNPEVLARWQDWEPRDIHPAVVLAELPGVKGPGVHRRVMWALVAEDARARTAGVDALVTLAATAQLQPDLLELPEWTSGKRLAGSLRDAVLALGAHRAWPVIDVLLPPLLAREKTTGLADVLAVAADCARRCGAVADYPAVVELAQRRGSGRLVLEARTLLAAFAGNEAPVGV